MRYYYMLWFLIFSFLVPLTAISQTNVPAAIAAATITPGSNITRALRNQTMTSVSDNTRFVDENTKK